jgi:hypothetical protein
MEYFTIFLPNFRNIINISGIIGMVQKFLECWGVKFSRDFREYSIIQNKQLDSTQIDSKIWNTQSIYYIFLINYNLLPKWLNLHWITYWLTRLSFSSTKLYQSTVTIDHVIKQWHTKHFQPKRFTSLQVYFRFC